MIPLEKVLQWGNVKQPFRPVRVYSGIMRHVQELFRNIHAYSEPCVTLACLEPWYILNPDTFRTRSIFRIWVCSELLHSFGTLSNIYDETFLKIING